jgi:hypothetical protein
LSALWYAEIGPLGSYESSSGRIRAGAACIPSFLALAATREASARIVRLWLEFLALEARRRPSVGFLASQPGSPPEREPFGTGC